MVILIRAENCGREIRFIGRIGIELCLQAVSGSASIVCPALSGLLGHTVAGIELYAGKVGKYLHGSASGRIGY